MDLNENYFRKLGFRTLSKDFSKRDNRERMIFMGSMKIGLYDF